MFPGRELVILPLEAQVAPEPLTQADYEAIKGTLPRYRDILLCKVLRSTGLRIAEVLRLTPQHYMTDGMYAYVLAQRGKKRTAPMLEKVYLPPELGVELRDYIKGNGLRIHQPIFGITTRQVERIFNVAGLKAIGRPVHPHEFRGLYLKWLIDNGLPVEAAAKMVGHADVKTTLRHYYNLTGSQKAEIQRRVPV